MVESCVFWNLDPPVSSPVCIGDKTFHNHQSKDASGDVSIDELREAMREIAPIKNMESFWYSCQKQKVVLFWWFEMALDVWEGLEAPSCHTASAKSLLL